MYYIGLDIHKKSISFCVKDSSGQIYQQGKVAARRSELDVWVKTLPQPWTAAMEATIFTGCIYDHLKPHAAAVKVAHPLMLKAIAASKKKDDRIDASKIAISCAAIFCPSATWTHSRFERGDERCAIEAYWCGRVQLKTRLASLLMETGVSYDRQHLHRLGFVSELLASEDVAKSIRPLLRVSQD